MKTIQSLSIFLVDDDKTFLKSLEYHLQRKLKPNIKIKSFVSGEECLRSIDEKPDIVVLDYLLNSNFPDAMNGMQVLQKINKINPEAAVIMVSGQEKMEIAIDTLKNGAYDYVLKNQNVLLKIQTVIKNAISTITLNKKMKIYNFGIKAFITIVLLAMILVFIKQIH